MYRSFLKRILIWLVIPLLALYISTNWYQLMLIQGRSMLPAYNHLQLVLLNRHDRDYTYGDVIAFSCDGLSCVLVKRIAACSGDTVVIKDGILYVNGLISNVYPPDKCFQYAGLLSDEITLKQGTYLVLGDNAAESKDSRYPEVGLVMEADIFGKIQ